MDPLLGSLGADLLMMMSSTSAQAATYYTCSAPSGCQLSGARLFTSSYTDTKSPAVLAHGFGGFTKLFGVLDYFYGIEQTLMRVGTDVYSTKTSATNN